MDWISDPLHILLGLIIALRKQVARDWNTGDVHTCSHLFWVRKVVRLKIWVSAIA